MKTFLLSTVLILSTLSSLFAQGNNLIFFTPEGESFYVIINGVRQNDVAQTNVMVQNVVAAFVKVKIIFDDKSLGEIDKTLPMPEYTAEITMQIKMGKKGDYVVRYFGDVPIAQAPPPPANRNVIVYTEVPRTTTTVTQTTTTTGVGTGTSENVNVGMNVGGFGMDVNVNVNDNTGGTIYEETTVVTTTTTDATVVTETDHYVMPGYNGPIGCSWPMTDGDFAGAKQSIAAKSFEDSKYTVAKQILNSNCMTSNQVKEVMLLFDFEDTRLDFAKYAYGYTFDLGNYYKVNDAFTFELSIDDLNDYIESQR